MKIEKSILDNPIASLLTLALLVLAVVAIWWWLPELLAGNLQNLEEKGQYGDSYGAINALFTGLAFAALIFTILLQRREIKLQRLDFQRQLDEMKLSREEIERQASIQEKQMKLSLFNLQMKVYEAEIAKIEMDSEQYGPSAKSSEYAPRIDAVRERMQKDLDKLRQELA